MKTIIKLMTAASVAALALSCTKDIDFIETQPQTVPLTVNVGTVVTRATVNGTEDMTLKNVQVIVFNDKGKLEKSSNLATNTTSLTLDVLPGKKTVWAVANIVSKISESAIPSIVDLSSKIYDLENNAVDKLSMSGFAEKTVSLDACSMELLVKHMACKVVLDGVKRSFTNPDYAVIPLTVKKIYISNVAGKCSFGCEGEMPSLWYNQLGIIPTSLPASVKALTVDDGLNISLPEGGSYNTTHTFYAFPNPSTDPVAGGTWSPRQTRLVLECDYGGNTCYYPITITGPLLRNKVYHISMLTLKKPGSTSPDDPNTEVSSTISFAVQIKVADWEGDNAYTEEF
ncbi:MAG: hypothetical protein J6X82_07815 [Bacteroidales bacterium]|nr:hypothetical protein [Bacteroidales bacterium]